MTQTIVSHVGICTRDVAKSIRFYCGALGFTEVSKTAVGPEIGPLIEIDSAELHLRSHFLECEQFRLELMQFDHPAVEGNDDPGSFNKLGLTHLAIRVAQIEEILARVKEFGGRVLTHTEVGDDAMGVKLIYVLDPDGVRIELMKVPGDPRLAPGEPV